MPGRLFLGFDGGGTKSQALLGAEGGKILASLRGAECNFQDIGVRAAQRNVAELLRRLQKRAARKLGPGDAACFGMAGADRDKDHDTIRRFLRPLLPMRQFMVVNDARLLLRLGAPRGVGVALISGTGANSAGVDARGRQLLVGGWVHQGGGGGELGRAARKAAIESYDNRGPHSLLELMVRRAYGLRKLDDMLEFGYFDRPRKRALRDQELVPLVFRAAARGDRVARRLLDGTAFELFRMARVHLKRLFKGQRTAHVVLGGSLLQAARPPLIQRRLRRLFKAARKGLRIHVPSQAPAYGALAYAFDSAGRNGRKP